jgi:hypothetical protein
VHASPVPRPGARVAQNWHYGAAVDRVRIQANAQETRPHRGRPRSGVTPEGGRLAAVMLGPGYCPGRASSTRRRGLNGTRHNRANRCANPESGHSLRSNAPTRSGEDASHLQGHSAAGRIGATKSGVPHLLVPPRRCQRAMRPPSHCNSSAQADHDER